MHAIPNIYVFGKIVILKWKSKINTQNSTRKGKEHWKNKSTLCLLSQL